MHEKKAAEKRYQRKQIDGRERERERTGGRQGKELRALLGAQVDKEGEGGGGGGGAQVAISQKKLSCRLCVCVLTCVEEACNAKSGRGRGGRCEDMLA